MSYIGNTNTTQGFIPAIDYFSGNGSTVAFTLSRPVASVAQVQANISNVPQNPSSAFSVSGNTITFTSAPPNGTNNIYVYYTSPITQVIAPGQGTVTSESFGTITNFTTTGNTVLGDASTDTLNVGNGGLVKDASGNVGMGTASPSTKLHLYGSTDQRIRFENTGWTKAYQIGNDQNALSFYDVTAAAERMRIDTSGNVGIGTASPSSSYIVRYLQVDNATSAGIVLNAARKYSIYSTAGGDLNFLDDTAALDRMRITSSGNLLVGTSGVGLAQTKSIQIPGPALVSSTRNISVFNSQGYSSSAGLPVYCANWASSAQWGIGPDSGSADNTVRIGIVNADANGAYWNGYAAVKGGAYTNASDYRLKKNVETVAGDVLSLIAQARPVSYNMIQKDEDGNDVETRKEIGFIAHELQALFPEFVTGEKDQVNGAGEVQAQGVDYAKFTAILVKAIQEQQTLITTLTDRITALENK
jgi:hypothetical protein